MKIIGIMFLTLPFILSYVVYASDNKPEKLDDRLTIDPKVVLQQLPENASPKDKSRAAREYLLLKALKKQVKKEK